MGGCEGKKIKREKERKEGKRSSKSVLIITTPKKQFVSQKEARLNTVTIGEEEEEEKSEREKEERGTKRENLINCLTISFLEHCAKFFFL